MSGNLEMHVSGKTVGLIIKLIVCKHLEIEGVITRRELNSEFVKLNS